MPTTSSKPSPHPLHGSFGIKMYVLLVSLGVLTTYLICSGTVDWAASTKSTILELFLFVLAFGWFAFAVSKTKDEFLGKLIAVSIVSGPVIAMILTFNVLAFWTALPVFVVMSIRSAVQYAGADDDWKLFLSALYAAWISIGLFITLGSFEVLPYARSALRLEEINIFLSIRFLVTAFVVVVIIGKSMLDAYSGPPISIAPLPDLKISARAEDDGRQFVASTVIVVINAVLTVVQRVTNSVWQVVALIGVFLYRTGRNLANYVYDLITNKGIWFGMAKVSVTYVIVVLLAIIINLHVDRLHLYLVSNTAPFAMALTQAFTLILTGVLFGAILLVIVFECKLWAPFDSPLNRASLGGAGLLIGFALAAFILYLLTKIVGLRIEGFTALGSYTLLLLLGLGAVFVYQVTRRAGAKNPTSSRA